MTPSTLK